MGCKQIVGNMKTKFFKTIYAFLSEEYRSLEKAKPPGNAGGLHSIEIYSSK